MDIIENNQITASECLGHWYYRSKFELLKRVLQRERRDWSNTRIADIGCGMGVFLSLMERDGFMKGAQFVGVDPGHVNGSLAVDSQISIYPDYPDAELFDAILMMDVLEHVPEPEKLLVTAVAHCKPGGLIFITVPAHQWLWSAHDEFLGHYRRYNISTLEKLTEKFSELGYVGAHYFYVTILPIVIWFRLMCKKRNGGNSDLKKTHSILNKLLKLLLRLELKIASCNKFAGVSVVSVLKRRY